MPRRRTGGGGGSKRSVSAKEFRDMTTKTTEVACWLCVKFRSILPVVTSGVLAPFVWCLANLVRVVGSLFGSFLVHYLCLIIVWRLFGKHLALSVLLFPEILVQEI